MIFQKRIEVVVDLGIRVVSSRYSTNHMICGVGVGCSVRSNEEAYRQAMDTNPTDMKSE